jgi:hypothetical protein
MQSRLGTFVYSLFYPGVLGSMIFDILDPMRGSQPERLVPLVLFGGAFVADYFHLTFILSAEKRERERALRPFLDALIAGSFCMGYFGLTRLVSPERPAPPIAPALTLVAVTTAYALIFSYESSWDMTSKQRLSLLSPLVIAFIGLMLLLIPGLPSVPVATLAAPAASFAYIVHVMAFARDPPSPPHMPKA